jgi:hypothetical protein
MRGGWIVRAKPVGRAEWGYGPSAFSVQMTDRWRPFFPEILAAKLQQSAECFATNRNFLRGVTRLGGFLARTSDGEPGWQTIWKGWVVLMSLVEGYELAQATTSPK